MTFKEYLTELFDKPAPIQITKADVDFYEANFKVENNEYSIEISKFKEDYWSIYFSIDKIDGEKIGKATGIRATKIMKDRHVVMATVIKFAESFYSRHPNDKFRFSCLNGASRVKLYDAIANKFASKHNLKVRKIKSSSVVVWEISNK
jgi:ribosomal protein L20A (L18A)